MVAKNSAKGFIRTSLALCEVPILVVKKKDKNIQFCVEYQRLNEETLKNCYSLSLIQDTLMHLWIARWYTKLDVRNAYNLFCITHGDMWKTVFQMREELFKLLVMSFGLMNAHASFKNFINNTLVVFPDKYVTAYLNDFLISSDTLDENHIHVGSILDVLSRAGHHFIPEKC